MPTFDPVAMGLTANYRGNPDWSANNDAVERFGELEGYSKLISADEVASYSPTGEFRGNLSTHGGGWMGEHGQSLAKAAIATMGAMAFAPALGGAGGATTAPVLGGGPGAAIGTDLGMLGGAGAFEGAASNAAFNSALASSGGAGNWLTQAYQSLLGPGTALGGAQGTFGGMGATGQGWLKPLLSIGSGLYGMSLANSMKDLAQQAISGSAPWTSSGGTAMAGDALKTAISGDLSNDPGYKLAQLGAARTSAQQPGGFAAAAAANAAIKYRNETIGALSGPAGVGFNPAAGYQTAISGTSSANDLLSKSLGSIGFGMTGESQGMPPWLQAYLLKNGMGG